MSRNSKNARKILAARARKGQDGPAKTQKLNKKKNTWWTRKDGKAPAPSQQADSADVE